MCMRMLCLLITTHVFVGGASNDDVNDNIFGPADDDEDDLFGVPNW